MHGPQSPEPKTDRVVLAITDDNKIIGVSFTTETNSAKRQIMVTTKFHLGGLAKEAKLAFPLNGKSKKSPAMIESIWADTKTDIEKAAQKATRYAGVKFKGEDGSALLNDCIANVVSDYERKYHHRMSDFRRADNNGAGHEGMHPVLDSTEILEACREVLKAEPARRGDPNAAKLDKFERVVLDIGHKINQMNVAFAEGMPEMSKGDPFYYLIDRFVKTVDMLDEAVSLSNAAWFKVAEGIGHKRGVSSDLLMAYADELKDTIKSAKSSFDCLSQDMACCEGMQPLQTRLAEIAYGREDGEKGIFQQLDMLAGLVNQPALLQETVAKGLPGQRQR